MHCVSSLSAFRAWSSATSSIASEVLYRGCSVVIAVVEIPTTRIGPAWRNTGRASGWGLCDCFFRFVADDRSI